MVLREITERYSVKSFSKRELPDEIIKNILEAGRLAPSWVNMQPWHFIVIKGEQNKALLSQLAHGQSHVENASAVIICCGDKSIWEKETYRQNLISKGMPSERVELFMKNPAFNPGLMGENAVIYRTLEQMAYALAYMTIEAQASGAGACVIGAIGNELTGSVPEVHDLALKTFEIPDNFMILNLLAVGYPAENLTRPEKTRKPFDEAVSWGFYGNKQN